jgi:hypothetical protein
MNYTTSHLKKYSDIGLETARMWGDLSFDPRSSKMRIKGKELLTKLYSPSKVKLLNFKLRKARHYQYGF